MNISITPELEAFIQKQVESGRYVTSSEVVREALRLLIDQEQLKQQKIEKLRQDIELGYQQSERGETLDGDAVFDELRRIAVERKRKTA